MTAYHLPAELFDRRHDICRELGITPSTREHWRINGLTAVEAAQAAEALGCDPEDLWPHWDPTELPAAPPAVAKERLAEAREHLQSGAA